MPGDALQHRAVLGVDRHELAAALRAPPAATSSPAMTSDSLLASATRLPARSAASVASSPAAPTSAFTTMSTSGWVAASSSTSGPGRERRRRSVAASPANAGRHSATCASSRSPVAAAGERHDPEVLALAASTRSVLAPIEPVEPSTATPRVRSIR